MTFVWTSRKENESWCQYMEARKNPLNCLEPTGLTFLHYNIMFDT